MSHIPYPDRFSLSLKENLFLAKKNLVAQIHHLSRFEDCKTTLLQTELIVNGQNVASASLDDIQTILNLKRGYQYVLGQLSGGAAADMQLLKKINLYVAFNDALAPGEFRTGSIGVSLPGGKRHEPPPLSEREIADLAGHIREQSGSVTEAAIRTMLVFMRSQIFWDGNKRTAMLFANAMMIGGGCGVLEIPEHIMPAFNEKLSAFYRSADDRDITGFLYEHCIFGIEYAPGRVPEQQVQNPAPSPFSFDF